MLFDNDNQDRPPETNRFFFVNSPQKRGPILSREGYAAFITSFSIAWMLCIAFVISIHLQVSMTDNIVTAISSSAVDLAALTLAVLGILHEFNKEDRWFKLGLLLVGFLFAVDCLLGYYLVVSWQAAYGLPQGTDIKIIGIFFIGFLLQTDWTFIYSKVSIKLPRIFKKTFLLLRRIRLPKVFRLSVPFVIPFALISLNNLTPVLTFLLIFLGGIIALLSLMLVTSFTLLRKHQSVEDQISEDPVITYSRKIASEQLENNRNVQNLLDTTLAVLTETQQARMAESKKTNKLVSMVAEEVIVNQLRLKGTMVRQEDIKNALRLLIKQNRLFYRNAEYWIIPSQDQIEALTETIKKITWFGTKIPMGVIGKSQLEWKNLDTGSLLSELAGVTCAPIIVLNEFVLPKMFSILYDPQCFERFEFSDAGYSRALNIVFTNVETLRKVKLEDWTQHVVRAHCEGLRSVFRTLPTTLKEQLLVLKFINLPKDFSGETNPYRYDEIKEYEYSGMKLVDYLLSLTDNSLIEITDALIAKRMNSLYYEIIHSEEYQRTYHSVLSTNLMNIITEVIDQGLFINSSSLVTEFSEYHRKRYEDFLTSLGMNMTFMSYA
jgi:hypothetical protein